MHKTMCFRRLLYQYHEAVVMWYDTHVCTTFLYIHTVLSAKAGSLGSSSNCECDEGQLQGRQLTFKFRSVTFSWLVAKQQSLALQ